MGWAACGNTVDKRGQRRMNRLVWANRKADKESLFRAAVSRKSFQSTQYTKPLSWWDTASKDHSWQPKTGNVKLHCSQVHRPWAAEDWKKTRWHFSNLQWACAQCSLIFLFLADSNGTQYASALVADLPQGSVRCVFWDGCLLYINRNILSNSCIW